MRIRRITIRQRRLCTPHQSGASTCVCSSLTREEFSARFELRVDLETDDCFPAVISRGRWAGDRARRAGVATWTWWDEDRADEGYDGA